MAKEFIQKFFQIKIQIIFDDKGFKSYKSQKIESYLQKRENKKSFSQFLYQIHIISNSDLILICNPV